MGHDHSSRLVRAADQASASGVDALLVTPSADLLYLTGYDPPLLERLTVLVLRPGSDPVLLVPELERPRAEASPAGTLVEIAVWQDGEDQYEAARRLVGIGQAFAAADRMWAAHLIGLQRTLPGASFVSAAPILAPLRARKDPGEVALLSRAGRGADEAFRRLTREPLEGRPERDVARSLAGHLQDAGHESVGFTIVASGPNGASPHHEPGDRSVRRGDSLVLDFGGRVGGYCSDITRTLAVGEPSEELREVHEIVRLAQQQAFEAVGPGVPAEEVDRAARRVIEEAGYGPAFVHRTGHGIGLEEHEHPYLVAGNGQPLEVGNCFSIEPGIYLEGRFGVRIEDIVAVAEDGVVRLNHAPRQLMQVG
jgi:D-alanyl-D-alanine dipeptidase